MNTSLFQAAQRGDLQTLQSLLSRGAHLKGRDAEGKTALHLAAAAGHLSALRLLLEAGADLEARDDDGRTPLFEAVARGWLEGVTILLRAGADTEKGICGEEDEESLVEETPLLRAAWDGKTEIVALLLEAGADAWTSNHDGRNALHLAAFYGRDMVVQLLLQHGLTPNARAADGEMALHLAMWFADPFTVEILLEAGADVLAVENNGATPLHYGASHLEVTDEATTADPVPEDIYKRDSCEHLLNAGADLHARARSGLSALDCAVRDHLPHTAWFLMQNGARFEVGSPFLDRALFLFCAQNWPEAVTTLLESGANGYATDGYGHTPMVEAARCGSNAVISVLLEAGIGIKARDEQGPPLCEAA